MTRSFSSSEVFLQSFSYARRTENSIILCRFSIQTLHATNYKKWIGKKDSRFLREIDPIELPSEASNDNSEMWTCRTCFSGVTVLWQKRDSAGANSRPVVYGIGSSSDSPLARCVRVKFALDTRSWLLCDHSSLMGAGLLQNPWVLSFYILSFLKPDYTCASHGNDIAGIHR